MKNLKRTSFWLALIVISYGCTQEAEPVKELQLSDLKAELDTYVQQYPMTKSSDGYTLDSSVDKQKFFKEHREIIEKYSSLIIDQELSTSTQVNENARLLTICEYTANETWWFDSCFSVHEMSCNGEVKWVANCFGCFWPECVIYD